jgi:lambda repressor-like predicted transcriptional regulator
MMNTCTLHEHLKKVGKSIRGGALEIGIEPHLMNAYVHGKRPNQRNAMRVATGLGVKVRELWPNFDELRPY